MADQVVVRGRGEGTALWMLGGLYEVRAAGAETGGSLTAMEVTIPVGMGPPPHVHDSGELAYVIEGSARYQIDGRTVEVGPGSVLYFPKDTLETFEPTSRVRMLLIYTPGGLDEFFVEAGEPAQTHDVPPPPEGEPDLERLQAMAAKYGLELRAPQTA